MSIPVLLRLCIASVVLLCLAVLGAGVHAGLNGLWQWLAVLLPLLAVGLGGGALWQATHRLQPSLADLQVALRAVGQGDLATRCEPQGPGPLVGVQTDFNHMAESVQRRTQTLQRRKAQLRTLTEHLPAFMAYVDRDLRYQYCNTAYERSTGLGMEALVGHTLAEVLGPRDHARVAPYAQRALAGETVRFTARLAVAGQDTDFQLDYVPDRTDDGQVLGFYVMRVDIGAHLALERQLAQALAWQSAIFESTTLAVIATDVQGLIQNINPAGLRLLRYRADELVQQFTPTRFHDPIELVRQGIQLSEALGRSVSGFEVLVARAREGVAEEREWTYVRKDGSHVPVSVAITAIRNTEQAITGFLAIACDITERKQTEALIRHQAYHDPLTQLPNRALLDDRLKQSVARSLRSGSRVAVIMVDIDHFKRVNDSYGHHVGDRVLQTVAQRLRASVRPSDTVARMGGDEFVVLLDGIGNAVDIERITRLIKHRLEEPLVEGPHELQVSASIGVAVMPNDGTDNAELLKNADAAMYEAKAAGRNTYRLFDKQMMHRNTDRMAVEAALRLAMAQGELSLQYQPQFDLETGDIMGMEALLRCQNAELGPVSPAQIISVAEECGLIQPLGHWVLTTACREAAEIQRRLGRRLGVAVNLSPAQFAQPDLPDLVAEALRGSGLEPNLLELEITEGIFMQDSDSTANTLSTLRAMGVSLSIDDFGTGYSSLSYLTRYTVDWIKIDQSFVQELPHGRNAAVVSTAIISIAHSLGMMVIAEGIENQAQHDYLMAHGCDLGQGYLFSQPMPMDALVDWVNDHMPAPARPMAAAEVAATLAG